MGLFTKNNSPGEREAIFAILPGFYPAVYQKLWRLLSDQTPPAVAEPEP